MRYFKIIFGGILAISGFIQLIIVINLYITLPSADWPIGSELGTGAVMIAGIFIFKSGLKNQKDKILEQ